jgi:hypothetical protein
MIVCDNCPYRGRCEIRQRCIQGKNPVIETVREPRPAKVVQTTSGFAETAAKIGAPIKGGKKKARKVTMQ